MSRIKKYIIPIFAVILFDIISMAAIMIQMYIKHGFIPPFSEVAFSTPIIYFWILWSALIFYCINGIASEYNTLVENAKSSYPLVSHKEIVKTAKEELIYTYSKKLLLVFAGLPLIYLSMNSSNHIHFSLTTVTVLLIPFMLDLFLYCVIAKRKKSA